MGLFLGLLDLRTVHVREAEIDVTRPPLPVLPGEEKLLGRAVEKRRREFAIGRNLARDALRSLGYPEVTIPANDDRSPRWPEMIVGSISHCNSYCAAAVASADDVQFLGIDIEEYEERKLSNDMISYVCVPEELDWLAQLPVAARKRAAMAIFSAKEAWYKACYPETRTFLDFKRARIEFDLFALEKAEWHGVLLDNWGTFKHGEIFPFGVSHFDSRYVASAFVKPYPK